MAEALDLPLSALLVPSPDEVMTPEEQRWRMVLRMHGIQPSAIEDIVHTVRVIEESEAEQKPTD